MHRTRSIIAALLAALAAALPVAAQTTTSGSLRGTVTDPNGGILPGAQVTAIADVLVSGRLTAFTTEAGVYRFPSLPPGIYSVEASLSGFKPVRQENVVVGLGQTQEVNLQLALEAVTEEIVVLADAAQVSTVSNTVSHNLGQAYLDRQPLPRDATGLMNVTPGVNADAAYGAANAQANAYNLDGVNVNDPADGNQWILPNFDWIQEVQVTGLGAEAEYGGFTGAVVNLVTKSGSNELSGDVSAYYSGGGLNSENAPEDAEGVDSLDSDWDVSANLGGKLVQDRLWFFISAELRERALEPFYAGDAPEDDRADSERSWDRYLGKLTFQVDNSNKLVGLLDYDGVTHDHRGVGDIVLASGAQRQESPNWAYNASWESLVSNSSFLAVKLTGFNGTDDRLPYFGDRPGRYDADSDFEWDNYRWTWPTDKQRLTLDASWSLFADDLLAADDSHTFKFGVVYEDSSHDETRTRNGGFTYYDDSYYCDSLDAYFADPECALYSSDRGSEIDFHAVQEGWHAYVQDSWQAGAVTVNLGARYTAYQGGFQGGNEDVYDVDMIAPRLGLVWDLGGHGKRALKAHYGRYYQGLMAFMYDREASGNAWSDLEYWDWNFDTEEWEYVGGRPTGRATMDPDIAHPYVDQYLVTFEQQLTPTLLLGLDYVHRENQDILAMVNQNDDYDSLTAPDNPLTGGDLPFFELLSEQEFWLTNPEDAYRDYDSVVLRLAKRYADGWSLNGSVVWADTNGNTVDVDGYEDAWEDWNGQVNNDGRVPGQSEWQIKVDASVDLPWDVILSGYYRYLSGTYWTPYVTIDGLYLNDRTTVNMLPLGSYQLDDTHTLDLRLQKTFRLGAEVGLTLMADVFNLLDADAVTAVQARWGTYYYQWDAHPEESEWVGSSGYARELAIQNPREIRLGMRVTF